MRILPTMNGATMMGLENPVHLLLVLVVLLLVFGAKRLPEMGRSMGHGLRGFKEAISGDSITQHLEAAPVQPTVAPSVATPADTTTPVPTPVAEPAVREAVQPLA
jgi:sec-independent protein translocase protein TatA